MVKLEKTQESQSLWANEPVYIHGRYSKRGHGSARWKEKNNVHNLSSDPSLHTTYTHCEKKIFKNLRQLQVHCG